MKNILSYFSVRIDNKHREVVFTECKSYLIRRCKHEYYNSLDKKITDNKKFWKYAKPFLSGKITSKDSLKIVSKTGNMAQIIFSQI